jgi:hypothetical protein
MENEIGTTCSMQGKELRNAYSYRFQPGSLEIQDNLEDLGISGRILK